MKPLLHLLVAVISTAPGFRQLPSDDPSVILFEHEACGKGLILGFRMAEWRYRIRIDCLLKHSLPSGATEQVVEFLKGVNRKLMKGCVEYVEEEESIMYSETQYMDQSMMEPSYLGPMINELIDCTLECDGFIDNVLKDEEEASDIVSERLNAKNHLCGISTN